MIFSVRLLRPKKGAMPPSPDNPILMLFSGDFNVQSVMSLLCGSSGGSSGQQARQAVLKAISYQMKSCSRMIATAMRDEK
jgi:hypothetical protein